MDIQLAEDLSGIKEMGVVNDPVNAGQLKVKIHLELGLILLDVPSQERKVENQRQPVAVDEEEEREETVDGSFGNDVGVEAVAEVDRVDIVTRGIGSVSVLP